MLIDEIQSFARDFINVKSFRTTRRKAKIREAYKALTGEEIKVTCNTCYIEALLIIINSQPMATREYELKKGYFMQVFGHPELACSNGELTDEKAKKALELQPGLIIYFSRVPGTPVVAPNIKIIPPTIIPPVLTEEEKRAAEKAAKIVELKKSLQANKVKLAEIAKEKSLPDAEWEKLNRKDLSNYLFETLSKLIE